MQIKKQASILWSSNTKERDAMSSSVAYKIKNWSQYNKALVNRGNVTVWFNQATVHAWQAVTPTPTRGRPQQYSDLAIECALTFRSLFHLPLRATQGFLEGLAELLQLELPIPDYTTLSRRAQSLEIGLKSSIRKGKAIDIVIDSTGLKIYGEGEWKVRTHGKQKRRTWRKLHIAIDPDSHETISMVLSPSSVVDRKALPELLKDRKKLKKVYADGAYFFKSCFDVIAKKKGQAMIPATYGSVPSRQASNPGEAMRDDLIREVWRCGGRESWKKESGYHKRSLVETQMYRYKQIFGGRLSSRKEESQLVEAQIKIGILNKMTQMGMPQTERVSI